MSNGQRQAIRLPFPLRGIDENWAFDQQPEGTASDALNVRPYDAAEHRLRGGQRDGLSKYIPDTVNGSNHIQLIDQVTLALDPSSIVVDTLVVDEQFDYADGTFLHVVSSEWTGYDGADTSPYSSNEPADDGIKIDDGGAYEIDEAGFHWALYDECSPGEKYIIKFSTEKRAGVLERWFYILFRGGPPADEGYHLRLKMDGMADTDIDWTLFDHGTDTIVDSGTLTIPDTLTVGDVLAWEIHVSGNKFAFYCRDTLIKGSIDTPNYSSNTRLGIGMGNATTEKIHCEYFEVWSGITPTSLRQTKLVTVSGGNIYTGDRDHGLTIAAAGTGVLSTGRWPSSIEAFQKLYLCDGHFANYGRLTLSTNTWDNWATATDAWSFAKYGAESHLPRGSTDTTIGCRYGTLYRGRIVLWGLYEEPQNWFMSASAGPDADDGPIGPLDWNYSPPTTRATQAVAGNNSDAGELGDVLIACAPYSDDLMVMGGDHTLWIMRGDPASGGIIDNISYQTGICSPGAFAWSPEGEMFFVGAGQLWRMTAGSSQPESISQRRLDKTFRDIDLSVYRVELIWNRRQQGLHIFLIPDREPAADAAPVHIYWDRRTDSFWKDQYPEVQGPTAIHTFDADDPDDRATLLGGWDSYIRYINESQTSDDGTAIGSYVNYTPIMPWGPLVEGRMTELTATMSIDSDPALILVSGGPSAEYVTLESPLRYVRTLQPGQNPTMRQRVNGTAFMIRIYGRGIATETWAMGSLTGVFSPGGRSRRRGLV